jgi:hypothetical protein
MSRGLKTWLLLAFLLAIALAILATRAWAVCR